jgi:hypothetical protein
VSVHLHFAEIFPTLNDTVTHGNNRTRSIGNVRLLGEGLNTILPQRTVILIDGQGKVVREARDRHDDLIGNAI